MNELKKIPKGLIILNIIIIISLLQLIKSDKKYLLTENSAPIGYSFAIFILLLFGVFFICGLIFGLLRARNDNDNLISITIQIIILTIIIGLMYIGYFFIGEVDVAYILMLGSIVTLEQISGYIVGCVVLKLIKHYKNRTY